MVEIVNKAEEDIKAAREAAEKAKQAAAAVPGAAAAIDAQLKSDIASIVAGAAGLAQARDAEGAGKIATLATDVGKWAVPYGNPTLPESGGAPEQLRRLPRPQHPAPKEVVLASSPSTSTSTTKARPIRTPCDPISRVAVRSRSSRIRCSRPRFTSRMELIRTGLTRSRHRRLRRWDRAVAIRVR